MKQLRIVSVILTIPSLTYSVIVISSLYMEILEKIAFNVYGAFILPSLGICIANIVILCVSSAKAEAAGKSYLFDILGILFNVILLLTVSFAFLIFIGNHF